MRPAVYTTCAASHSSIMALELNLKHETLKYVNEFQPLLLSHFRQLLPWVSARQIRLNCLGKARGYSSLRRAIYLLACHSVSAPLLPGYHRTTWRCTTLCLRRPMLRCLLGSRETDRSTWELESELSFLRLSVIRACVTTIGYPSCYSSASGYTIAQYVCFEFRSLRSR